jgi:hypothetical protein
MSSSVPKKRGASGLSGISRNAQDGDARMRIASLGDRTIERAPAPAEPS